MENKKSVVRLHNNFVEAIFSLSTDAKKLLLLIILHATKENEKNITIYRGDIIQKVGLDIKQLNKSHREALIEELMKKIITIRDLQNPNKWIKIQLLGKTVYEDGILTTRIDPDLMPFIIEARERLFTRFKIQNIKPLRSIYAIRFYLFAKQYLDIGWRELDLGKLRTMLQIEKKYPRVFDLKKRVLEPAKEQINQNTDIVFDYELVKTGKRYTKIKLFMRPKNYEALQKELLQTYRNKAIERNGQRWFLQDIKIVDQQRALLQLTNLSETQKIDVAIDRIDEFFQGDK